MCLVNLHLLPPDHLYLYSSPFPPSNHVRTYYQHLVATALAFVAVSIAYEVNQWDENFYEKLGAPRSATNADIRKVSSKRMGKMEEEGEQAAIYLCVHCCHCCHRHCCRFCINTALCPLNTSLSCLHTTTFNLCSAHHTFTAVLSTS